MTSSPRPMSSARRASKSASVPLAQPIAYFVCESSATCCSSRSTGAPRMNSWESTTSIIFGTISSRIVACWARKSSSGTGISQNPSEKKRSKLDRADTVAVTNVFSAAGGTPSDPRIREAFPALAHPPDPAGGDAGHQGVRQDVLGHHGSGADEGVFAERDSADDRRVGADRRPAPDQRAAILVFARNVASRVHHVGEHHRRPAEDVVLELDPFV